jgi:hypothetical protein
MSYVGIFNSLQKVYILPAQPEQRHQTRLKMGAEISFKIAGSPEKHWGRCKSISGSGVSFIAEQPIPQGKAVEIHVYKNALGSSITAFTEVIRSTPLPDNHFEIAAVIKSIKGC